MKTSVLAKLLNVSGILTVTGFSLSLGSIVSFIAMNIIAGETPTTEFWYWQRKFVSAITNYVTLPGIWLFFLGNTSWFLVLGKERKKINYILVILPVLTILNAYMIIVPVAKKVNKAAVQQIQLPGFIKDFTFNKSIEDISGGINMLFLLSFLAVYFINRYRYNKS